MSESQAQLPPIDRSPRPVYDVGDVICFRPCCRRWVDLPQHQGVCLVLGRQRGAHALVYDVWVISGTADPNNLGIIGGVSVIGVAS